MIVLHGFLFSQTDKHRGIITVSFKAIEKTEHLWLKFVD